MSLENGGLNLEHEKTNKELFKDAKKLEKSFDGFNEDLDLWKNSQWNRMLKLKWKDWTIEKHIAGALTTFFLHKDWEKIWLMINNDSNSIDYYISETHSLGDDPKVISNLIDKFKKKMANYYIEYPNKLIEKKKQTIQDEKNKIKDLKAISNFWSVNIPDPEKMLEEMW